MATPAVSQGKTHRHLSRAPVMGYWLLYQTKPEVSCVSDGELPCFYSQLPGLWELSCPMPCTAAAKVNEYPPLSPSNIPCRNPKSSSFLHTMHGRRLHRPRRCSPWSHQWSRRANPCPSNGRVHCCVAFTREHAKSGARCVVVFFR